MYAPPSFREDRIDVLQALIARYPLATLVTLGTAGIWASHVPMLFDPNPSPLGTLRGHVARANPQWTDLSSDAGALAVFQGPQHYISPSWYPTKRETGRVVPTWNYVAVYAQGRLRVLDDPDNLRRLIGDLTDAQERDRQPPWAVTDAPGDFVDHQLKGIVGFELAVERLEGTYKVSQNRPPVDRDGVVENLREIGDDNAMAIADLVLQRGS